MDLARKIGIGVVFIVPTFVLCGLVYSWFDSLSKVVGWLAALVVFIAVVIAYTRIIMGRFSTHKQAA